MRPPHIPQIASRRDFLFRAGTGFASLALASLLEAEAEAQQRSLRNRKDLPNPLQPKPQMFPAKAKSVIFLFMNGGPSHVDLFDYKPGLLANNGKSVEGGRKVMASPFLFPRMGRSGLPIAEVFPELGKRADDLCLVHSIFSSTGNHTPAVYEMNTGKMNPGFPSVGAWVTYGLGTENQNLPAFVALHDGQPAGGALNWGNGYLPATYQGTVFRAEGVPIPDLKPSWKTSVSSQRATLDFLAEMNLEHSALNPGDSDLEARIAAYELAYRMQMQAPQVVNINQETTETKALYGLDKPETQSFGRKCLLARRLVQNGVRFVQLFHNGWDAHDNIAQNHRRHATEIDRPIAGLLTDLKRMGLLESTLVVWGGEFGRTPAAQNNSGRDHHAAAHTVWLAGGGVQGGVKVGMTDELGIKVAGEKHPIRDLHATILQSLGLNERLLTYLHNGRQQRLTDTGGNVIKGVLRA
jgi:hypothetical protein